MTDARNPRAEADAVLGAELVGRVLEPSPPAIHDDDFFADDPVKAETGPGRIVAPVGGDLTWTEYVRTNPDVAAWAGERWLSDNARLPALPDSLESTRLALQRLATYVIAPARHQANGKFGLRWTVGGFGTPFFGDDRQIRVEGRLLVVQDGNTARSIELTSLQAAADFIGTDIDTELAAEHDSPPVGDVNEQLDVELGAVEFLDGWWGLGTAALERIRLDPASVDPSRVQLWPGHFDPAMEIGDEDRRGSYGASPGDAGHPEPYLYVSVASPDGLNIDGDDPYWNAQGYTGALLSHSRLVGAENQIATAVDFFRTGRDKLTAS